MKGLLPEAILNRSKMGFPVPVGKWFRERYRYLIDDYVLSGRTRARNIFGPDTLKRLVEEHQNGNANHADRLWALLNFEMWMRQFIDGDESCSGKPALEAIHAA
jgi:asparagine synthase (glutamine-hydrolysing)